MCSKFSSFIAGAAIGAAATYFGATKEGREKVLSALDKIKFFVGKPVEEPEEPIEDEDL